MRKLASIRAVSNIRPIEGKDFIEQVNVGGWNIIVKKGEFKEGDLCVYVEIDSQLPPTDEFKFLEKKKYIIKTMKMSGVRSEGIVFPTSILPKRTKIVLGADVTKVLGITQYNKEVEVEKTLFEKAFSYFMRYPWFRKIFKKTISKKKITSNFPHWIRKTDEERIQNCKEVLSEGLVWEATEKVDGSSATFGLKKLGNDMDVVVCSRNTRLYGTDNVWYAVFTKYELEKALMNLFESQNAKESVVIQGEVINSNIQKNKYKVTEPKFYVFNILVDGVSHRFSQEQLNEISDKLVKVPVVFSSFTWTATNTVDEVLNIATYNSKLNPDALAEGLVFRTYDENQKLIKSFKAVSPTFLMKNDE